MPNRGLALMMVPTNRVAVRFRARLLALAGCLKSLLHLGQPTARAAAVVGAAMAAMLWNGVAGAQSAPSLVTMVNTLRADGVYQFDGLEFDAAAADDAAYAALLPKCGRAGTAATCAAAQATIFQRLRELEDNANQLLGSGETLDSLRLNPQGLGAALRWTAPEEYAAQGSLATRFANSQVSLLSNRFAALRFAAQSNPLARYDSDDSDGDSWLGSGKPLGGSAGADSSELSWGRLSVFANGSSGTGTKAPTTFEDAFDFDDTEASIGADYRLSGNWVVGILAGHSEKRVDFNSELSVVAGRIRGNGQSGLLYAQFENDYFYVNGSFGLQHLTLDTSRRITYPSNNPDIPSVDDTALSDTGANTLTATLDAGYLFHYKGFSAEPYLNTQYVKVRVNAFTEVSSEGFAFDVGEQNIHAAEANAGLKLQYVVNTPVGVIVPYVYGEYRRNISDSSRIIDSTYSAIASTSSAAEMTLPTDGAPNHYYVVGGGGSVVLPHGLQGYIQYLRVLDYTNYTDHVVAGGLRWEL
jgi:uncharacterized protein with beta-barrel porin domain